MLHFIKSPLINANEDTAVLVHWNANEGDFINVGEVICTMETTKSTFDVQADTSGYFHQLTKAGEQVQIDQPIAVITDTKNEPININSDHTETVNVKVSQNPTWTVKARLIAQKHHLIIEQVEKQFGQGIDQITEEMILNYISQKSDKQVITKNADSPRSRNNHQIDRILVLGGGNIAVLVLDILTRVPNQQAVGILDDNPTTHGTAVFGCPILGKLELVTQLWEQNAFDFAALAIGQLPTRAQIYEKFSKTGIPFANIIDSTASISTNVQMGSGNMIMGFCRIGPECVIGDNNFLSAYINLEHHNRLGNDCTFGPGVVTSGGVIIGDQVRFGTGIFIEPRLTIGSNSTIASGVILTTNVPENTIVKSKTNFIFQFK